MSDRDPNQELSRRIARTLDRSLDALDPGTLDKLRAARLAAQSAPGTHRRRQRAGMAFAAAATVAMLAIIPWIAREPAAPVAAQATMYLDIDPELLDDLDLLEAIGDVGDAG